MRKELGGTAAMIGMVMLGCLFGSLALAIYPGWTVMGAWLSRADTPALVQAVGSVAAIAVAIAVPARQQLRQKKDENRRYVEARLAIARSCYLTCDEAAQTVGYIARNLRRNVGTAFRLRTERVTDLLATLQTLVGKDIPPELLKDLLSIQRELSYTQMALKQLWAVNLVSAKRAGAAEARERRVIEALDSLKKRHQLYDWIHSEEGYRVSVGALDFSDG